MNLLSFKNRFKNQSISHKSMGMVEGYMYAMEDLLKYMEQITQFNSSRRVIDAADILKAISETSEELISVLDELQKDIPNKGLNLHSDKVKEFLKDQLNKKGLN